MIWGFFSKVLEASNPYLSSLKSVSLSRSNYKANICIGISCWLCFMKIPNCEYVSSKSNTIDSRSSAAKILGCTTRVTDWIQENAHFCCQNDLWDREKTDCKACGLNTVQDFLCEFGMKPHLHLLKISVVSLYNVIVKLTKIMNGANKNWASL